MRDRERERVKQIFLLNKIEKVKRDDGESRRERGRKFKRCQENRWTSFRTRWDKKEVEEEEEVIEVEKEKRRKKNGRLKEE